MRSARVGKWREIVAVPTPAPAAMPRTGASTPAVTKIAAAASSRVSLLRRASARLGRAACPAPASLSFTAPSLATELANGTSFHSTNGTMFRLLMMPEQGPTTKPRIATTLHPLQRRHARSPGWTSRSSSRVNAPSVLLGFDPSERVGAGGQRVTRRLPGGIPGVELGAEVGPGEPLDRGDSLGILVRGLGDVISRAPAESVLCVEQGEQGLGAGGEEVRIGVPVRAPNRQMGRDVLVAGDHEGGRR